MSFKVIQFNMQFGQIWDPAEPDKAPIRLEDTIAEIRTHDADIVMLQEVERGCPGTRSPQVPMNYPRLQQGLSGYHSVFAYPRTDARELPFGIGLAIFSKTPLQDLVRVDLPSPPVEFHYDGEKKTPTDRVLIRTTTRIEGRELTLLNTHLLALFMLNSSSEIHNGQREMVAAELRAATGPTILTGDFNVSRHESLVAQFSSIGFATVQTREVTWRRRPYVLDHIFYNQPLRLLRHEVKPTLASDHHVMVAEFEFA
ncbi:MAG: endonuclease/exonuclease/phosphatase family protein [Opitutales bacterium]